MIKKISFANFKVFKTKQTIELKPLTILIGKNNTGKSAIIKLPTLIAGSLSGRFAAPLNWRNRVGEDSNNSVELGGQFKDLLYNRNAITNLELSLWGENEHLEVAISIDGFLKYQLNGEEIDLTQHKFKGFLRNGKPFNSLSLNVDYIEAFRAIPQSNYVLNNEDFDKIGVNGKNAYPILIKDFNEEGKLLKKVCKWYAKNFDNWQLEVIKIETATGTSYEIAITNEQLKAINLVNTGQGIHQALPLIVRSYMEDDEDVLIIVEEPETHLHPAAHGNLAERFAESYLANKHKNYLIETHSQNFVLRLRRLIAEGKLKQQDVAIYYVDFDAVTNRSSLTEIPIDDGGGVDWWPKGIFNETTIETKAIYNAQQNDVKNVDRNR